jgi:hypothetical protein
MSVFEDGQRYKNYSEQEWNLKNSFSYDDYKGFSDLKLLKIQNTERCFDMEKTFDLPVDFGFCRDFSVNNKRNRLVQRHLCLNNCFWNPQLCLFEQSHSGDLVDLMKKSFHDTFNPDFASQFKREYSGKIDWSLTGGVGHFPSIGLKKLIQEMGITSKLSYDSDGCAINFDNLSREFRDSDPVRPLFVMEEKKVNDIIEALLNVNSAKIESNKKEMQTIYGESYNANGSLRKPILSLMMWGPLDEYEMRKIKQECSLENCSSTPGSLICSNFTEEHYWMYSHGDEIACNKGIIQQLSGPAMTKDMKVIYPCNMSACNHGCECGFCDLSSLCPPDKHRKHIQNADLECIVQRKSQCQDHWIDHPDNFAANEDILVEKNIFFHNGMLASQPRERAVEVLKFSGIKKTCTPCCKDVLHHLKFHMVIHLQCKFCLYQLKTLFDKKFWEKVCNSCGKTIYDTASRKMYWHKKIHSLDWSCEDCEIRLNRKWNFKRHLLEVHGLEFHEIDNDRTGNQRKGLRTVNTEKETLSCSSCKRSFTSLDELKGHLSEHTLPQEEHTCADCGKTYKRKDHLQRHERTMHGD